MGSLASDLVWGLVNFGRESRELVYLIIEVCCSAIMLKYILCVDSDVCI